ncbi:hypothetical protein ACFSUS_02315 [Spirosoma soli]|uniref:Uncharacterized protein n=1 Tax=Spirosoma soli TaxID=1770529 RepID=A0ABW5LYW3_9BACT
MKRTIRNRTVRILLLTGFGLTILLITIRHYYEATTSNTVRTSNESVIQSIGVLNNAIELTLELSYSPHEPLSNTTAQAIYKSNRSARNMAAIRPLLDSLVSLTSQTSELNPLARRLQTEAQALLQSEPAATEHLISSILFSFSEWAARFRLSYANTNVSLPPTDLPLNRALQGRAVSSHNLRSKTETGFRLLATPASLLQNLKATLLGPYPPSATLLKPTAKSRNYSEPAPLPNNRFRNGKSSWLTSAMIFAPL